MEQSEIKYLKVGDKVTTPYDPLIEYYVVQYVGPDIVVVKAPEHSEIPLSRQSTVFYAYKKPIELLDLIKFGDDLVSAIENAGWVDYLGNPNLIRPTPHMKVAIKIWKEETKEILHEKTSS